MAPPDLGNGVLVAPPVSMALRAAAGDGDGKGGESHESFYAARQKIYPRELKGRYTNLRLRLAWLLLAIFYLLPWLNMHGRQAVLFDIGARKFYVFALEMWPQDFIFLTWLLVIAAMSLFFFTALAGRVWCAYACPQTVWTEAFLWMERITEGSRQLRMKLDAAPWGARKLLRKGSKQVLWISFALWTGVTFVGYFAPLRALAGNALHLTLSAPETFWALFYGAATYANAGLLREQVCKYMCPYARFQSAMFDKDTLVITPSAASRAVRAAVKRRVAPTSRAIASTARCACRCAPPASISAMACSTSASPVPHASTPATMSWITWATRAA
jgi:cytochrome c oxidase accessory protein FixG